MKYSAGYAIWQNGAKIAEMSKSFQVADELNNRAAEDLAVLHSQRYEQQHAMDHPDEKCTLEYAYRHPPEAEYAG